MSVHRESADTPSVRRMATRDRLLDAAAEVFAEEGVQGASVESICTRAGFTRGAFYSNFETKEQLFLALLEREFDRRAAHLADQAASLAPQLREKKLIDPSDTAQYIVDFFAPETGATTWFVLETEFLLLAMRDPSIAPDYHQFMDRFYSSISGVVERVILAAGRQFTLPAEQVIPALANVYERALRTAALTGTEPLQASEQLGNRLAELLFALTEPVGDSA